MGQPLSPYCVYTISHTQQLDNAYRSGGSGVFEENTMWKTGRQLFLEARDRDMRMPVVFASADVTDRLIYCAMLSGVEIDDASSTTRYEFTNLTPINGEYPLSSLRLRSTNRPLSDDFIRPYAVCHTPSFIAAGDTDQAVK
jgi:hypothetical protein